MLTPNTLLQNDRYRIIRLINQGGMGAVYEAQDNHLNNRVAIKETLVGNRVLRQAFEKEAQRLDRLRHTGLPKVKDYFVDPQTGVQYLVMEYIEGRDLGQMLAQQGQPFAVGQVLAWADEILDALAYLHARGIVHRDIKPANLKLTSEGEMILLDFGLAKGGLTQILDSVPGYTLDYAPPEQIAGEGTDERSDIYALGATLYSLLTRQPPNNAIVRQTHMQRDAPDLVRPANQFNPQVPTALASLLTQMMALDAEQRPANVKSIRRTLAQLSKPQPNVPSKPPRSRVLYLLVAVAVILFVIVVGGLVMLWQNNQVDEPSSANPPLTTLSIALQGTPIAHAQRPISPDNAAQVPSRTSCQLVLSPAQQASSLFYAGAPTADLTSPPFSAILSRTTETTKTLSQSSRL